MPQSCFDKKPVYIFEAARTAIGSPFKSLKNFCAVELGGLVISGLLKRAALEADVIDQVILGNAVPAGTGQNLSRQASFLGGLLPTTSAYTVNNVCGSGLQAVILAGQTISFGSSDCIIALGAESATRTPELFSKSLQEPFDKRTPIDSLFFDGLWCSLSGLSMGQICENFAKKEKISRKAQDRYAFESHQKAAQANFEDEIVKIALGDGTFFSRDEHIRHHGSLESYKILPCAFADNGTITSGNASVPCDGAAGVVVADENFVRARQGKPLARLLGYASIALEPKEVFTSAVAAVNACLQSCRLTLKDIDLFEVSEAFAAQAIYTRQHLQIPTEKMNIFGGDIALGHPLGASGTRILVTLIYALQKQKKKYGLAVICYGGGGAIAVIVDASL